MDQEVFIRTSERSDWMRCRQKWWWAWEENIKPKETATPLWFGTLIHGALEAYYKPQTLASWQKNGVRRGPKPWKTFEKLYAIARADATGGGMRTEDDEWIDAFVLGIEMLKNYVEHYGADEDIRVVQPEKAFQVDIHDAEGEYLYTYVGTFDGIVQQMTTKKYGLLEHKTAKSIVTDHLSLDEQAGSYWALAPFVLDDLGLDVELDFILYNFLRKAPKDPRPTNAAGQCLNKDGGVSKIQPSALFERQIVMRGKYEQVELLNRATAQAREMQMVRDGELALYKSPMMGCRGMFGCQFRDMCELHETGGDWEAYRGGMFTTWNPYEDHEKKDAES